ncbi:hypothetical protein HMPREF0663_11037 [Hoylesella oralis ATCC 33269]|uniref:Uncharacterized protein n=1 Tax=Hoylesella oralis ATCC 33269 TaxID=873533 RepID=E7RPD6_9BACT|nr:hypothetical protein HMPREF0663_11037 [Hoylesella oralis ATCC 33269]
MLILWLENLGNFQRNTENAYGSPRIKAWAVNRILYFRYS